MSDHAPARHLPGPVAHVLDGADDAEAGPQRGRARPTIDGAGPALLGGVERRRRAMSAASPVQAEVVDEVGGQRRRRRRRRSPRTAMATSSSGNSERNSDEGDRRGQEPAAELADPLVHVERGRPRAGGHALEPPQRAHGASLPPSPVARAPSGSVASRMADGSRGTPSWRRSAPGTLDGIDPSRIPRHVAAVMDGNGRWAQQRGLKRTEATPPARRRCSTPSRAPSSSASSGSPSTPSPPRTGSGPSTRSATSWASTRASSCATATSSTSGACASASSAGATGGCPGGVLRRMDEADGADRRATRG